MAMASRGTTRPIGTRYGVTGVPTTFVIDKKGIIQQVHPALVPEVRLRLGSGSGDGGGGVRPPNAPPLWQPGSTAFSQLGEEVQIGAYRIRPPLGYVLTKLAEPGHETYRWIGPVRQDGTKPVFEVSITAAPPGGQKLEDVLEKDMQAIETPRLGWNCGGADRGDIKGLAFGATALASHGGVSPPEGCRPRVCRPGRRPAVPALATAICCRRTMGRRMGQR